MDRPGAAASRTALVAGATGLVGGAILQGLLADEGVAAVHALARRPLALQHPRLTVHVVDFAALPPLPRVDEAYLALGTTIKVAGSQPAFRAVDFDANLAVARAVRAGGTQRAGLVSAMGADAHSSIFYSRVKGELERDLRALGFNSLTLVRPGLIGGERNEVRRGERLALTVLGALGPVLPRAWRINPATEIARALVEATLAPQPGEHVVASSTLVG